MLTLNSSTETALVQGERIFLGPSRLSVPFPSLCFDVTPIPELVVGALLGKDTDMPLLRIVSRMWWPGDGGVALPVYTAEVVQNGEVGPGAVSVQTWKPGFTLAWITLSDKGYAGLRQDTSGPLVDELARATLPLAFSQGYVLPDERCQLTSLLVSLALEDKYDLIVTTGGTGLTARDVAPEATLAVIEKRLAGMEQAMVQAALTVTPHGMLSRAVAGTLGKSLILNLPGSPKAVKENLSVILPTLEHAIKKLHDDPTDCARA